MSSKNLSAQMGPIYRIPPYYYLHVLDQNTSVTRLEIGPKKFFKQDNETIVFGPDQMITLAPRHYCVVENPVVKNENGQAQFDKNGQVKLSYGSLDVRLEQDYKEPFPLYPGEVLNQAPTRLKYAGANSALRLKAVLDFDDNGEQRKAGDEWLFEGPGTYTPRKEVSVEEHISATVIGTNQAVKLTAKKELIDRTGQRRVAGESWLVKQVGAYLPLAYEMVVSTENAYVVTDKRALHLRALKTFIDDFGQTRNNGDEWLITKEQTETHILNVYEQLVAIIDMKTLNSRQYCVILNPFSADGKNQFGKRKLVVGEKSFFLQPNEQMEKGIQDVFILCGDEGVVVKCIESFQDEIDNVIRVPGEQWVVRGPREYIPPVQVEVLQKRKAIPLDENEGIYVRNLITGRVRAVIGNPYMLTQDEELWEKELPVGIEEFLRRDSLFEKSTRTTATSSSQTTKREKSKVVTYRVPQNQAVQVYDYKAKTPRIIFGPELVMLGPDEHFTYINLSGSLIVSLLSLVFLSILLVLRRFVTNKRIFFPSIFALILCFFLRRYI
ncbi:unnamed protein product [Rotaria socialis]|uniref:Major vault protein n=2 Tax=Rotaria socialis TaxID=392032 RepID=A0A818C002_9BILA|nr:unnamed protein product [Rotaria socialis]CAF3426610.1 unnamed protein product [Rotaria socialis]CAF4604885.1 unnamed protein product [Rotaria socialis]